MRLHALVRIIGLAALCLAAFANPALAAPTDRPNIILFLVDDMGWTDCGAYGSQYYETPQIDRLATRGMLFTDCYSANPLCSPTRASILSGQYPARHGITIPTGHLPPQPPGFNFMPTSAPARQRLIYPESKNYLEPGQYTIAEALHDAGYRTAHFGKWHLGLTEPYWPEAQGFDVAWHAGPDPGPGSYFSPYSFRKFQTFADGPPGEYIVDRMTTEALEFIEQNRQRPFLLHMWQYGVHGPWGHKEEYTRQFVGKKDPRGSQGNPIMASMLRSIDESLGRVVARLDELKLTDNTVIIFTSDNGGNVHSFLPTDPSRRDAKPNDEKVAAWRRWAGDLPPTNNLPLRSGKGWLYEGGIRIPLVVVWPGVVAAGSRCSTPVCSIDFYPTMLEMARVQKHPQQTIDGESLSPLLKQTGSLERKALFNFFPHGSGNKPAGVTVRQGDWKLIRWWETNAMFPDPFELYNLRDDLGETKNLAASEPDRVKQLDALIDGFLSSTGALVPQPNPNYQPAKSKANAVTSADLLLGWIAKSCKAEIASDALRVEADGRTPFITNTRFATLAPSGSLLVKLRTRSATGGEGKFQWRTTEQDEFPKQGQVVSFTVPTGADWAETAVEVPVAGQSQHVRIYLPLERGEVEIDWIRLGPATEAAGKTATWDFGGAAK